MPRRDTGRIHAETSTDGAVLILEIDAAHSHNALTPAMAEALAEHLTGAQGGAGAVALTGANTTFCAGMNALTVREALESGWEGPFESLVHTTHRLLRAIVDSPVPIIAGVDGHAAGLGVTLAILADTRVTTPEARLRPGHLAAGAPLDGGASYALGWALGPARSMGLLLEHRPITGVDLHHWGLAGPPVSQADLKSRTLDVARRAAALEPSAFRSARALLRASHGLDFERQWADEVRDLREAVTSGRLAANLERLWSPS